MKTIHLTKLAFIFLAFVSYNMAYAQTEENPKEEVLSVAEQMPEYPGGMENLYKFLSKTINYPIVLKENKVEGKVICSFIVGKDGSLSEFEIVNKPEPLFAEETIRVMKLMPKWIPGKQNGKPVNVKFTLPVKFQLK